MSGYYDLEAGTISWTERMGLLDLTAESASPYLRHTFENDPPKILKVLSFVTGKCLEFKFENYIREPEFEYLVYIAEHPDGGSDLYIDVRLC